MNGSKVTITDLYSGGDLECFLYPPSSPTRCICDRKNSTFGPRAAEVVAADDLDWLIIKAWSWGGDGAQAAPAGSTHGKGGGSGFGEVKVALPITAPVVPSGPRAISFSLAGGYTIRKSAFPTRVWLHRDKINARDHSLLVVGGGGQAGYIQSPTVQPGNGGPGGGLYGKDGTASSFQGCVTPPGRGATDTAGGLAGSPATGCDTYSGGKPGGTDVDAVCGQWFGSTSYYNCSGPGWYAGGVGPIGIIGNSLLAGGAGGGSTYYPSQWPSGQPVLEAKIIPGAGATPGAVSDEDRWTPNPVLCSVPSPPLHCTRGMGFGFMPPSIPEPTPGRIVFAWADDSLPPRGDLDKDGKNDLVFRNASTWKHLIWFMNETTQSSFGSLENEQAPGTDRFLSGMADFNLDRVADLVFWKSGATPVEFWLMNGDPISPGRLVPAVDITGPFAFPDAGPWNLASTGDFDYDGRPDLVWRNQSTQKLSIWTMNGTTYSGSLTPTPDQAVDGNWIVVGTVDLNGDGFTDFLWYNWSSGKIVYWLMDETVTRTTGAFTNPPNAGDANWRVRAVGDYGVGQGGSQNTNDIVWRNETSGRIVVWHMDLAGNRTWGLFTTPDSQSPDPTTWDVVGPK